MNYKNKMGLALRREIETKTPHQYFIEITKFYFN